MSGQIPTAQQAAAGVQVAAEMWDAVAGFNAAYAVTSGDAAVNVPLWRDLSPSQQTVFMLAGLDQIRQLSVLARHVAEQVQ